MTDVIRIAGQRNVLLLYDVLQQSYVSLARGGIHLTIMRQPIEQIQNTVGSQTTFVPEHQLTTSRDKKLAIGAAPSPGRASACSARPRSLHHRAP
jgi:hypothetical protein